MLAYNIRWVLNILGPGLMRGFLLKSGEEGNKKEKKQGLSTLMHPDL
jgi:hypothetical protein